MFKNIKLLSFFLAFIIAFLTITYLSFTFVKEKQEKLNAFTLNKEILNIKNDFKRIVLQKQKATLAIAISLVNNQDMVDDIINNKIDDYYFKELSLELRTSTLYKNIWVQIIDNKGFPIYQSWTDKKGGSLLSIRPELNKVIETKQNLTTISIGRFDLSIKSIAPIFKGEQIIGVIEVISHFNSISKLMSKNGVHSVVVANKEYTKHLLFPFTNIFIDGHYIANSDALKKDMDYLANNKIENYLKDGYKLENGYLIISYPIKDFHDKTIAYSIMFKKENIISKAESDFLLFKWMSIFIIVLLNMILLYTVYLFMNNRREKKYNKDILDSVTNIVLVFEFGKIIKVNETFFKYFNKYDNIKIFKAENDCICDFFVEDKGCLPARIDDMTWLEYVLSLKETKSEVKINFLDKTYVFIVEASPLLHQGSQTVVVLSDITAESKFLKLSVTDELTQIGNRRYFNKKLDSEISRSKRHKIDFSLVVFDIDYFKKVNDTYGHDTGDEVLKTYSEFILNQLREEDILCRIGGEEFAIILPNINKESAESLSEKLRLNIENYKRVVPITMSFGVTEYKFNESSEELYKRADTALYSAKENGRNRVVVG